MSIKRNKAGESGMAGSAKLADLRGFSPPGLGQQYPSHYPSQPGPSGGYPAGAGADSKLGLPLDIRQVARLLGCSPWSVRNRLIPMGLPHFRFGASSKLIFYEGQVVRWIERQQQGGNK